MKYSTTISSRAARICAATLLALVAGATAQTYTAVTDPVGFTKITVPAAASGTTTKRILAIPYNRPSDFQGLVSAVGANTITFGSANSPANFSNGAFTGTPHYAKVRKGTNAGRFFLITSHTNNTLTVNAAGATLSSVIVANDTVEILPAQTLGNLFGTSSVALHTGADETTADSVRIFNGTAWVSYFNDGTSWRTQGTATAQDNTSIAPDQGILIISHANTSANVMLYGEVGVSRERSTIPGTGEALLNNRFPVQTTLANLNLQSLPGWTPGDAASVADNVWLWNGTSWDTYYYTGANWEKAGSFSTANNTSISPTTAIFVHRKAGSSAQNSYLTSDPAFTNQ